MGSYLHRKQRNWGCRVSEYTYQGLRTITLENEKLRVSVLAEKGTDIFELNYKPRDMDFMTLTPGGVRDPASYLSTSPDSLATFMDYYPGGWQEILPNGGGPSSSLGARFGQHGEVCMLPWDYEIVEDSEECVEVRFSVRTQKTPLYLEKTLQLRRGEATLSLNESLTNESEVSINAMWGQHIALGHPFAGPGSRIGLADGVDVLPHPEPTNPEGRRVRGDRRHRWPVAEGTDGQPVDLSVFPEKGVPSEMLYLTGLPEGRYSVSNPESDTAFQVEWDVETMPYLWYWGEYGASKVYPWYGRAYMVGLEPFSSYSNSGLEEAVRNGSALVLEPGTQRSFWLRAGISDTAGELRNVTAR